MESIKINSVLVREMRERKGWSQEQLAAVAGVSARTIQRVEQLANASLETRMAVAAALAVDPETLLTDAGGKSVAAESGCMHTPPDYRRELYIGGGIALLLVLLAFGYQMGKDAAFRDNARDEANTTVVDQGR